MEIIRLVGVIRQSKRMGDHAISDAAQREAIETNVDMKNRLVASEGKRYEIVGWAIDLGVSADKTNPWERPELGKWLKKPEAFDGFTSMKLDRLCRSILDFAKLMEWMDKHSKILICTHDPIDLSTDMGRAFSVMLAVLAELELKNIKTRNRQARKALNEAGRWPGGHVPYGRKAIKMPDGWKLVKDPETSKDFRRILDLINEGRAFNAIAETLNREGVPTPHQRSTRQDGKVYQWTGTVISHLLRSRHLIGQREVNGVILRDEKGLPVIYCEPLMTVPEWNALQTKLKGKSLQMTRARKNTSLARKVGGCGVCGENLQISGLPTAARPNVIPRYRCASIANKAQGRTDVEPCGNPTIRSTEWDNYLESAILDMVGHLPRMEKVYVPGEDHTEELEQVDDAITSLQKERDRGLIRSEDEYFSRLEALMGRRNKLMELPQRPAGWQYKPTGETVAEYWNSMDREQRNLWLQEMGVRLFYSLKDGTPKWRMVWGDLAQLPLLAQGTDEESPTL